MATNHYKGQSNRISEDELPDDVTDEISATFSPDVIYALVRDAYYRGPVSVGQGGERRVYGGGKPGSGLRRPDGPLYDYPESWRTSVLRKATDLDLLVQVGDEDDDLDEATFAATARGLDLFLSADVCEDCGRVQRPTEKHKNSSRKLTKIRTECPAHGNGGSYERDEEEVERAREVMEANEDAVIYVNDDSALDERDPDGLQGELETGERVELLDHKKYAGRRGTVLPDLPLDPNDLRGVWAKRADEETVTVLLDRDEDGSRAYQRRRVSVSVPRNLLRAVGEDRVLSYDVFAEGQRVQKAGEGMDKTHVVETDLGRGYYEISRRGDGTNPDYLHAWELENATRYVEELTEDPEFEEGDEVRLFDSAEDVDDDRELGHSGTVAEIRPEDYTISEGWTYVVEYEKEDRDGETVEVWDMATADRMVPEEVAREEDPDPPEFSEGDLVYVDPEEHGYDDPLFRVVEDDGPTTLGNPYWTGDDYLYKLRPRGRRRTRSRREELNAYEENMSETFECEECGEVGNGATDPDVQPRNVAPARAPAPEFRTLCSDCSEEE